VSMLLICLPGSDVLRPLDEEMLVEPKREGNQREKRARMAGRQAHTVATENSRVLQMAASTSFPVIW
jgi:hypothetical protein